MPEAPVSEPAAERGSPRPRRAQAVYGGFILIVAAFVLTNIVEVVQVLYFGPEVHGARVVEDEPCRAGLEAVARGLEDALAAAVTAREQGAAEATYRAKKSALAPTWSAAERACAGVPNGPSGLAALTRLDRTAEATARRRGDALAPVRREVDSFIR